MTIRSIQLLTHNSEILNQEDKGRFEKFIKPLTPLVEHALSRSLHLISGQFDIEGVKLETTYIYNALIRTFFFETKRYYIVTTTKEKITDLPWYSYETLPNSIDDLSDDCPHILMEAVQTCFSLIQMTQYEPIWDLQYDELSEFHSSVKILKQAYFRFRIDFLISGDYLPDLALEHKNFRRDQWAAFGLLSSYESYPHLRESIFASEEIASVLGLEDKSTNRTINRKYNKSSSPKTDHPLHVINNYIQDHVSDNKNTPITNYLDGLIAAEYMLTCNDGYYDPTSYLTYKESTKIPPYTLKSNKAVNDLVSFRIVILEAMSNIELLNSKAIIDHLATDSAISTKLINRFLKGESSLFFHQAIRLDEAFSNSLFLDKGEPFSFYNQFAPYHTKTQESKDIAYQRFNLKARNKI
ncbi:hypothetical protein [Pseudoalteromonas pernae]|uniref:hypothetical protein n=1 Tax=Pseudoalteromonas pernae TaxID=3118054 RepID=UPI003242714E